MSTTVIKLTGLTKQFKTPVEIIAAVDRATFVVNGGEFVALMGPSGCGKTTLLGLIAGIDSPSSGEVEVLDVLLSEKGGEARGKFRLANIGMVFQEHNLISEFTSLENVMLPLEVLKFPHRVKAEKSLQALRRVKMLDKEGAFPEQLSGGQKQRVGIARALVGEKKIILADEPTGSLDYDNSNKVFELFRSMAADGLAVIVATHNEDVLRFATRILRMRDGRIIQDRELAKRI